MSNRELLIREVELIPEMMAAEVLDYVQFLKEKRRRGVSNLLIASETTLSKDWLKPEEDEAWKDL